MRYAEKVLQDACFLVRDLGQKYKNITRGHLIINLKGYSVLQHGCIRCERGTKFHKYFAKVKTSNSFRSPVSTQDCDRLRRKLSRVCGSDYYG